MTKPRDTVALAVTYWVRGETISEISRRTRTNRSTIRSWINDPVHALCDRVGVHESDETCPLIASLPSAAYAYLLGQYLGDGCISAMGPRGVYRLRIQTCDDYPEIRGLTIDALAAVVPDNKVSLTQNPGCTEVSVYSKHWPCLFPQHGPGRKHERRIELAPWQQAIVEEETQQFVAGLIHADGCRATNMVTNGTTNKRYEYTRYFFTNVSEDILMICADAFDRLGVERRRNRWNCLSVAKKDSVAILDSFIGRKT